MRCQACEKNDAHTAVICDRCREHYAAIREGQYAERVVAVGELNLAVRSWVAVAAPIEKKKRREEKVPKAKGSGPAWMKLMPGKAAEVPVAPVEEEAPPPDWKNRVFPVPDADDAPAAQAAPAVEPAAAPADALDYGSETEFSYGTGQLDEQHVLDLSPAVEAPAPLEVSEPEPIEIAAAPEAPELELAPAAEPEVAEPVDFEMTLETSVPQAVELPAPVVEEPPAPAPELSSFFESLATPEPVVAPEPEVSAASAEPVVEEAAPAPELSSFFESLSTPAASAPVEEPPVETPAATSPDLASFFSSLSAPAEPAAPAPVEAAPAAPQADLSSFFASLSAPAAEPTPEPAPAPVVEEPAAAPELSTFFESLTAPAAPVAAEPVVEAAPVPEPAPTPAPELASFFDTVAAPAADSPIADFFDTLAAPAPAAQPISFELPATPAPAEPVVSDNKKPFAIELDLPVTPTTPATNAQAQRQTGELKPPTHGQPFSIDLGGAPEPKPVAKKSNTAELKRQHSTAGAGFDLVADDDDDDASGGSLFEGLSFGGARDDDDDERTIEL